MLRRIRRWWLRHRRRPPRLQALPVSHWHVILAFIDLLTDTLGAFSTRAIALQLPRLCGMRVAAFFNCCFSIQLLLIAGCLLVHSILAAGHALAEEADREAEEAATAAAALNKAAKVPRPPAKEEGESTSAAAAAASEASAPSKRAAGSCTARRARAVAWAILRGITGTELAYQEFWRHRAPSPARTSAVLHARLAELVFEGPTVVLTWMVVLGRLTVQELGRVSGNPMPVSSNVKTMQWISAITGLVSLSVATADFMRVHGRSFWAGPPPDILFLGIIDVTRTSWWRSLLIGAHAFASLAARALLFIMLSLTLNVAFFDARHNRATAGVVWPLVQGLLHDGYGPWPTLVLQTIMTAGMVVCVGLNAALLSGMKSLAVVPCAIVNGFCNIPWAAAPPGSPLFNSPCAIWPSWVMQVFYGSITVALGVSSGWPTRYILACKAQPGQPEVAGYAVAYLNWLGSAHPDVGWGGTAAVVAVPLAIVAAEVTLFCIVNVVVWRERAAEWRKNSGGPTVPCLGNPTCCNRTSGGSDPATEQEEEGGEGSAGSSSSDGGGGGGIAGGRRSSSPGSIVGTSAATPALAYKFMWFKRPYILCSVRICLNSVGVTGGGGRRLPPAPPLPLPLQLQLAQWMAPQGQETAEPVPEASWTA